MSLTVYTSRTWRRNHGVVNACLLLAITCLVIWLIFWLWPSGFRKIPVQNAQTGKVQNQIQVNTQDQLKIKPDSSKSRDQSPEVVTQKKNSDKPGELEAARVETRTDETRAIPAVPAQDEEEITCQVPLLELENDAIKEYFYKLRPLMCNGSKLFNLVDSVLRMNTSVIPNNSKIAYCDYRAIDRISDKVFTYSNSVTRTSDFELVVNHDFFIVECYLEIEKPPVSTTNNQTAAAPGGRGPNQVSQNIKPGLQYVNISFDAQGDYNSRSWGTRLREWINFNPKTPDFQQVFSQISPRKDILERIAGIKPDLGSTQMNVLILGIDSMSHLSYQRTLPLTYQYLKDVLGATILNSYNVVGDGTTGAYIPLLTGKTEEELPNIRWGPFTKYADTYPLIWKQFIDNGYVTLYGEDYPLIETFQMRMNGFDKAPVDHYMRPFWQAAYDVDPNLRQRGTHPCLNGQPRHRYMLNYLKEFFRKYPKVPKFALEHLTGLSADDPNMVQHADADIREFLDWLNMNGYLDNTLLIVMSDHGTRFSSVQQTAQGKLEERLPMMSLTFPKHFQEKYPHLISALRTNTDRLTTPFDIHATLQTILDMRSLELRALRNVRGISLFREIPNSRTCTEAGIGVHWCSCLEYESLSVEDMNTRSLGHYLVRMLNNKTEEVRNQCIQLHLQRVVEARLLQPNDQIIDTDADGFQMDVAHYELTIQTTPNDGVYEATLRGYIVDDTVKVIGGISRVNKYRDQSKCIVDKYPALRKYCFCRP